MVLEEFLIAALPESHRLSREESIRLADLSGDPFVLFPRRLGLSFYDLAVDACRGAGFEPRVSQEATHMQTIVGLVAAGTGVSLVPVSVAEHRKTGVAYRPLEDETPPARIAVASRLGNPSHTVGLFYESSRSWMFAADLHIDPAPAIRYGLHSCKFLVSWMIQASSPISGRA
ncbi:MAG: LysR family substrate-binding domain-containing protein [Rubrobacteraceae bacterium]